MAMTIFATAMLTSFIGGLAIRFIWGERTVSRMEPEKGDE